MFLWLWLFIWNHLDGWDGTYFKKGRNSKGWLHSYVARNLGTMEIQASSVGLKKKNLSHPFDGHGTLPVILLQHGSGPVHPILRVSIPVWCFDQARFSMILQLRILRIKATKSSYSRPPQERKNMSCGQPNGPSGGTSRMKNGVNVRETDSKNGMNNLGWWICCVGTTHV